MMGDASVSMHAADSAAMQSSAAAAAEHEHGPQKGSLWSTSVLMATDLPEDDAEDGDYVDDDGDAEIEEADVDEEADEVDAKDARDEDESDEDVDETVNLQLASGLLLHWLNSASSSLLCGQDDLDDKEVSDLYKQAASLLKGRVLRSGSTTAVGDYRDVTIHDIADSDDEQDEDYQETPEAEEDDEDDEEEEDDGNEDEHGADEDLDEEEVKDIVVNASKVRLPSKDAIRLRDGKEIPSAAEVVDLTARLQELMGAAKAS
ncbi:hypothetical protein DFJ73DRAFT_962971 [Zopfochytrium polystomum]|nr:hypothetical protein DFJ73DRAFT_962971 [Zopfochytrium polystomum]